MNEDSNIPNKVLPNNFYSSSRVNNVYFKILVPSVSAGAIIGKRGESINHMQNETCTKVKISKSTDFYPGTKERVCLIIGAVDGIIAMHSYIMKKINDKLNRNMLQHNHGLKELNERQRQVKILVPNSTAGLIIGKSGTFIKDIKETTGAFVQISQKAKQINLLERCIIVAGEFEHVKSALKIILIKLSQDPQSKMYPNISYVDVCGPVASAFPTGSPYAEENVQTGKKEQGLPIQLLNVQIPYNSLYFNINNSAQSGSFFGSNEKLLPSSLSMSSEMSSLSYNCSEFTRNIEENGMRIMLKKLGYSDYTSDEIMSALMVLDKYGLLGKSYSSQANYLNANSNYWMPNNKPSETNKLNKFAVNYPCFRQPNINNVFFMPSVNEMSKNINFCQIQAPNYRTINPQSSIVSHFSPLPMPLQITPMTSPSFLPVCNYQIINCPLSQKNVTDIEAKYRVKIHIRPMNNRNDEINTERQLLTIIGNEQNIIEVLRLVQGGSGTNVRESQIINNYQTPGDSDFINDSQ